MRTLTIEYGEGAPSRLDVVDEYGRRCQGLCFGEMLEQVISLVRPHMVALQTTMPRYQMLTEDGWREQYEASERRRAARRLEEADDNVPF